MLIESGTFFQLNEPSASGSALTLGGWVCPKQSISVVKQFCYVAERRLNLARPFKGNNILHESSPSGL